MEEGPSNRHRFQSQAAILKSTHVPVLPSVEDTTSIPDASSSFYESLLSWRELNLTSSFTIFADEVEPMCKSMNLLLHNWKEVVEAWSRAVKTAEVDALEAIFDLSSKLVYDLRGTLVPVYSELLDRLLARLDSKLPQQPLQALLNALSSLLKYLLAPSSSSPAIQATWTRIANIFRESGEIARLTAEVWGKIVRRFKTAERDVLVREMLEEEGVEFYVAMALVDGMKAPNHSHSPSAPSLIRILLSHLASNPDHPSLLLTYKRILTALLHHTTPPHFAPLMDALLDALDLFDDNSIRAWMSVVRIPLSVRKGARLQEHQLKRLMPLLPSLPSSLELVHLCAASLIASSLSIWASEGKRLLSSLWENDDRALALLVTQTLVEAEWKGWTTFGLPFFLQHIQAVLSTQPKLALRLVGEMARRGALRELTGVTGGRRFLEVVGSWAGERIAGLGEGELTQDDICEMSNLLPVLPFLPSTMNVGTLVGRLVANDVAREDWEQTPANRSWLLSACLSYSASSGNGYALIAHIPSILERWSWNPQVLEALAEVVNALEAPISPPLGPTPLRAAILSQASALRTAALRLLCSPSVATTPEDRITYQHCLTAEEVPLTMEKVRERVMKTERVTGLAGVDWLIAQLKINLRPLWQPACQALAKIVQAHPSEGWERIYHQLETISLRPEELAEPEPRWPTRSDDEDLFAGETERTFRDPSLAKMDLLIEGTTKIGNERELESLSKAQWEKKRLDVPNFEGQLLKTLALFPTIAEKNNRSLVILFLRLVGDGNEDATISSTHAVPRRLRSRVSQWLTLLSKFQNPRALYRAADLQQLYLACLCTPESSIQKLAIDCLLTDSASQLQSYADKLKLLLEETKFRDELSSLDLQNLPVDVRETVVPVLIHLLYGIMVRRSSKGRARRRAILASLTSCSSSELGILARLMLEPFQGLYATFISESFQFSAVDTGSTATQRVGFLRLLGDVLTYLAPILRPHWPALITATLELLRLAQQHIESAGGASDDVEEAADGESDAASVVSGRGESARTSYIVRQLGFKRLSDFCRRCPDLDLDPYLPEVFRSLVSPRMAKFVAENSQAPSAMMGLLNIWSEREEFCLYMTRYDTSVVRSIADLLSAVNVKPTVVSRVLDILDHIVEMSTNNELIAKEVLLPNAEHILSRISWAISAHGGKPPSDILKRELALLIKVAPHLTDAAHAEHLLMALKPLFRRTGKVIQERIISDVLQICASIFSLVPQLRDPFSAFFVEIYEMLGGLFQVLRDRQTRLSLVAAFKALVTQHPEYTLVGELTESLNAYMVKRPEEPDFDRRIVAFNTITQTQYLIMGHLQWEPILWNALFFIQDPDELSLRTNAAFVIRRFIERLHEHPIPEFKLVFARVVYSGLRKALHCRSELVESEVLSLLGTAAEKCDFTVGLQEMRSLLAAGDEEASVLANFYHVQVHRRTRALRRLAEHVRSGDLGSGLLCDVFIPLLNSYIMEGSVDHQIINEAIAALGTIASRLPWRSYNALVQQYLRLSRRKTTLEKLFVRTIIVILEQFSFQLDTVVPVAAEEYVEHGEEEEAVDEWGAIPPPTDSAADGMAIDMPEPTKPDQRVIDVVKTKLLPTLLSYMDDKTTTEDEVRIPIAYGIVCVALKLPQEDRSAQIERLLIVLCQVLRSRSHDTRQLARETLYKITIALGPDYLAKVVQSLREALTRGPQLHVLAFSVHGLVVHVTRPAHADRFHTLDSCASNVAYVESEVIFGQSGKDVISEGFKTTFREVRSSSSKALDTFQLISRFVTVSHVRDLLSPLRQILQSTDTQKTVHLVNDVLHRIASGLNANNHLSPEDILSLCHTLITQRSKLIEEQPMKKADANAAAPDFAVQLKRKAAEATVAQATNLQTFVAFGLDLFNTAFRRNRFDLKDPGIIARLEPLVPLIGEALYTSDAQVATASVKASAAILRCPLQSAEKSLSVFIKRLLNLIRNSGSLDAQVAQAALKSLAIILRDCGKAKISEADLRYLLDLIGPELEEPERQSTAFTLLRAIISRQFVAPEIYDLMDRVFAVLVQNQSSQVREACRGIALQFLLDYPQGKGRLKQHMTFLARNLSYEYESGRLSIMELLGVVMDKFQSELMREYVDLVFAALVMGLANDDSAKCREMAGALVRKMYGKLEEDGQRTVLMRLHLWINQEGQVELPAVAAQVYGLVMDQSTTAVEKESTTILEDLAQLVGKSDQQFKAVEQSDEGEGMDVDLDWRAPYHALTSLLKLCRLYPALAVSPILPVEQLTHLFLFPHAWVRLATSRLVHLVLSARSTAEGNGLPGFAKDQFPAFAKDQLPLLVEVARLSTLQLRSESLDSDLSLQVVKNLLFVGRCFATVSPLPKSGDAVEDLAVDDPIESDEVEAEAEVEDPEEPEENSKAALQNPLSYLFTRLSFQLRRAHTARQRTSRLSATLLSPTWAQQPLAILRWFAAMSAHVEAEVLRGFLPHVLSPVYRILEDQTIRDEGMQELQSLCRELQELVQQKVGTTAFAEAYALIRQKVGDVRRERREVRVRREVEDPEAAAKERRRRQGMKERGRKRKHEVGMRGQGRMGGKRRRFD